MPRKFNHGAATVAVMVPATLGLLYTLGLVLIEGFKVAPVLTGCLVAFVSLPVIAGWVFSEREP